MTLILIPTPSCSTKVPLFWLYNNNHVLAFLYTVLWPNYLSLVNLVHFSKFCLLSILIYRFPLHSFLFLIICLLKNPAFFTCRISLNLDFHDCILLMHISLCLNFIQIGSWMGNLITLMFDIFERTLKASCSSIKEVYNVWLLSILWC